MTNINEYNVIIITGFIGLLAALLTGTGEFLLHFDPLARFSENSYEFMLATTDKQQTWGHFIGTLSAPLYVIGMWHIYLMLKPANQKIAFIAFLLSSYGFMIGADWISSRASIGALTHIQATGIDISSLVELYQLRYESLLGVVRITTLAISVIYIWLVLTGRSHYKKWQAVLNPILLLISNFIIYAISPEIGKYMMPIALNIGFGAFFIMSLLQARNSNTTTQNQE